MSFNNADSFLLGGDPSAKFESVGTTVSGKVVEPPELVQQKDFDSGELKFWNDGQPMNQLVVKLATDQRDPNEVGDDGVRRIFIKGQMKSAIAKAVRSAGATKLEVGGVLSVTYSGDGVPTRKGNKPPKNYTATYARPADAALSQGEPAQAQSSEPAASAPPAQDALSGMNLTPETLAMLAQMAQQGQK